MATYNVGPGQTYASLDALPRNGDGTMNIAASSEIVIVAGATVQCTQRMYFRQKDNITVRSSSTTQQATINSPFGSRTNVFQLEGCANWTFDGLRFTGNTNSVCIFITSIFAGSGSSARTVSDWSENITIQNCDVTYTEKFVHFLSVKNLLIQCCNVQRTQEYSILCTDPLDGGVAIRQGSSPNFTFPETYQTISRGIVVKFCKFGPSERESVVRFGDRWPAFQDLLIEDTEMDATTGAAQLPDDKFNPLRLHCNWRRDFTTEYTPSAIIRRCRVKGVVRLGPLGGTDSTGGSQYTQATQGNNYQVIRQRAFDARLKGCVFEDCYVDGFQSPASIDDPHGIECEMERSSATNIANTFGFELDQGVDSAEFSNVTMRAKNLVSVTNDDFKQIFKRFNFDYPPASQRVSGDSSLVLRPPATIELTGGVHMRADYFVSGSQRAAVVEDRTEGAGGTITTTAPSGITITGSNTFNGSATMYFRV